mgnify:CR=1 FL=1
MHSEHSNSKAGEHPTGADIAAFVDRLTPDGALTVLNALRVRFDWAGTMFTPVDVDAGARNHVENHGCGCIPSQVVEEVIRGPEYRSMGDRFCERGWDAIEDAISAYHHRQANT